MSSRGFETQDKNIKNIFEKYINLYKDEKKDLKLVNDQIKKDTELANRKNFTGHLIASVYVICKKTKRVLLLDHKSLKIKLPPGGHVDAKETPLMAALRELAEETGVRDGFEIRSIVPGNREIPLNVRLHSVPKNSKKNEEAHHHHIFEYLAVIEEEKDIKIRPDESDGYEWVDWDKFAKQDMFKTVAKKINKLAYNRSAGLYYESLVDQKTIKLVRDNNYGCLVVQHIVYNSIPFLRFLYAVFGENLLVFAKPKSVNKEVRKLLEDEGIDIITANRSDNFEKYLFGKNILMDIGGYFTRIAKKKGLPIIGIIETAETGLRKYEELKKEVKYPVVSAARSELKDSEDKQIGEAVVYAVEMVLRQQNIIIDYCRCGVIGYGKVGAGVANGLVRRNVRPYVTEKNPVRLVRAINDYCYATDIDYLVGSSKVIFSANGNVPLTKDVFQKIRNGSFVASVTSSDSEFDISALENDYRTEKVSDQITKCIGKSNYFYLINHGNAVNFLYDNALGSFIHLVLGENMSIMDSLIRTKKYRTGVHLSSENIEAIAEPWVREFITLYSGIKP